MFIILPQKKQKCLKGVNNTENIRDEIINLRYLIDQICERSVISERSEIREIRYVRDKRSERSDI